MIGDSVKLKELGRHVFVEFYDCDPAILDDEKAISEAMLRAAEESGATIVGNVFHKFAPQGVSGAVVIAESHLAIHTWPEYGYVAADLFTCGTTVDPWKAFHFLRKALKAKRSSQNEMKRGILFEEGKEPENVNYKTDD